MMMMIAVDFFTRARLFSAQDIKLSKDAMDTNVTNKMQPQRMFGAFTVTIKSDFDSFYPKRNAKIGNLLSYANNL